MPGLIAVTASAVAAVSGGSLRAGAAQVLLRALGGLLLVAALEAVGLKLLHRQNQVLAREKWLMQQSVVPREQAHHQARPALGSIWHAPLTAGSLEDGQLAGMLQAG